MNTLQAVNDKAKTPLVQRLITLLLLVIIFIPDLSNSSIIWWGSEGLFILIFMIYQRNNNAVITNSYFFLKLSFLVCGLISVFYIVDVSVVWNFAKVSIMQLITLFLLMSSLNSQEKLEELMAVFIIGALIMCVYILGIVEWSMLGQVPIGEETLGKAWNANIIGGITSTAAIMAMSKISKEHKRGYFIVYILLMMITILTGSRKATVCLIVGTVMITCMYNSNKRLGTKIAKLAMIGVVTYFIVTYIPFFYNIVGVRLESLILGIMEKGELDHSSLIRFSMIKNGLKMFLDKPLLGYGIDGFRLHSYEFIRRSTYAHNNYVEILFDTGIVGFIIYYALYAQILYCLIKNICQQENRTYLILLILVVIMEIGMVSYNSLYCQIIILMCYCAVKINSNSKVNNKEKIGCNV